MAKATKYQDAPTNDDGLIEIDTIVIFRGYGELEEGQVEILEAGEQVKVVGYDPTQETYMCESLDNENQADNAFFEELAADPSQAVEEEKPKAKPRSRTKPKAAAEKEEATEDATDEKPKKTPAKSKAPAKSKTKTTAKSKAEDKPADKAPEKAETGGKADTKTGGLIVHDQIKTLVKDGETAVQSAQTLGEAIVERSDALEESKFQLGGVLGYISENELYKGVGYETMEAFVQDRVGVGLRQSQHYIKTYRDLTAAGVTAKQIEGIGMSKLRALSGVIEPSNRAALLKEARKLTRDGLEEHVKEIKAGRKDATDTGASKMKKVPAMKVFDDQAEVIESALDDAKSKFSVESAGEALYHIATEYLQGQGAEVSYEDALAHFNATWGTDYEPVPEEGEEVEQDEEQIAA